MWRRSCVLCIEPGSQRHEIFDSVKTAWCFAMAQIYEGDGYEFNIRLPDYKRLYIHVTRAALEVLNEGQSPIDQLGVLVRHMSLLHELAHKCHNQNGDTRVAIDAADIKAGLVASRQQINSRS